MENGIQLAAAVLGSFGFAVLFNVRGRKLIFATIGGGWAWAVYLTIGGLTENEYICGFISSVMLTLYAEFMARVHKTPVTVFLVSAAIPLIPGAALYRSMNYLMQRQWDLFGQESVYTLLFAASMSAGITATTIIFRAAWRLRYAQRRL